MQTRHPRAPTQNADPALKGENQVDRTTQETLEAFDRRLAELPKIRKDNVRAVEILVGFSPSEAARLSKTEQDRYFADAKAWFVKLFGGPKNLLNTTIHADEHTSRHMTMFVMPIETIKDEQTGQVLGEKFNCKHWLGGAKRLSLLQTRFHSDVAGRYGLERGILGSKAKHQEVDRFYAKVQAAMEDASLPDPDPPKHQVFRDPNDEIKEAVEKRDAQLQPQIAALAAQAREADLLRKQNRSLRRTLAAKGQTDRSSRRGDQRAAQVDPKGSGGPHRGGNQTRRLQGQSRPRLQDLARRAPGEAPGASSRTRNRAINRAIDDPTSV